MELARSISSAVVFLFAAGISAGAPSGSLWKAARDGDLEGVEAALIDGTPVDARATGGATALFYAARYGHLEIVDYLAARGADVDVVATIDVPDGSFPVSALGAAALGGYADVIRSLFARGAEPPELLVLHHSLLPFDMDHVERQREYEVVDTILRMRDVEAIAEAIVMRDAAGSYRSHDGLQYEVRVQNGTFELAQADGLTVKLQGVGGRAFAESEPPSAERSSGKRRNWSQSDVEMLGRFLSGVSDPKERERLVKQYVEHGGIWLDFTIGAGQVLGFSLREGAPGRLGGPLMLFRKVGIRPDVWPSVEETPAMSRVLEPMNWPSFRGPNATGVADGQFPPTSWDVERSVHVRWKTPIPGLGNSSPVVWEDKVFLTTSVSSIGSEFRQGLGGLTGGHTANDRSVHAWKIYCLDRATGEILWERTARRSRPRAGRHVKSTYANPTPVTNGEHVVAFFGPEGLYAFDMDGRLAWQKEFGIVGEPNWGFASSPVLFRDRVIVQADAMDVDEDTSSFVAAFDVSEGRELWRTLRDETGTNFGTPTVFVSSDRAQLVTNGGRRIRSYDPMSGKELWSLSAGTRNVTPTPVAGHDLIFITSGYSGVQPIYAVRPDAMGDIDLKDGEDENHFVAWSHERGGSYTPTPIVYGDYLYVVNVSGILGCYDARTGKRIYRARLRHMGGGFSASPVASDGRLYFSSEDGDVFVVKAGPEFELLATNSMGEVIMATPAISGGRIFIRTLHHVFSIG